MVLNLGVTLSGAGGHTKKEQSHGDRGLEAGAGKEGTSERGNLFELLVLGTARVCRCGGYVLRLVEKIQPQSLGNQESGQRPRATLRTWSDGGGD